METNYSWGRNRDNRQTEISWRANQKREIRPLYRAVFLMLLTTLAMGVHSFRLVQLQVVDGQKNRDRADQNRIRMIPIPSNRGYILDRNDKQLAANRLTQALYVWPNEHTPQEWEKIAKILSPIINITPERILAPIEKAGYQSAASVRISQFLTPQAFIWLGEKSLPGVEVRSESNRYYPEGNLASQILGYIGEATAEDLKKHPQWPMGMVVGQLGIEAQANQKLSGVWGSRLIEVNSMNQELRELGDNESKGGENVRLTLDLDLQKTAEAALGDRRGAAVALNAKTGEILAMASSPRFDPNIFTKPISQKQWEELQNGDDPFLNRALQGYPPGSTFKIVSSAAAMGSGKFSPDSVIGTYPSITVGGITFNEHSGGYGVIGFRDALAFSSNTFYYQLGMAVGPEAIAEWGKRLGIENNSLKLLGLPEGSEGFIPTPEDKEKTYGEPWYLGDTVTMSIGQGTVLATPLELAVMVAAIANGGYRVKPHLLADLTQTPAAKPEPTGLKPEAIQVIKDGLISVVEYGTGQGMNDGSIPLTGGKTGTSEVSGQTDHSLYVAFGPAENPEIAIAVVVENGGYGAKSAAPIAKAMFQTYFSKSKSGGKVQ
ncbi:penicillin-binding protein 2 [Planktothrix agardhii 1029]|uniref:FtsI n=1 Tax=Planktothrix agardhii (strain NIVA-CYA 126/8) TaxID=388467 RepID=A0A073CFN8_PLAA1|nr:penicillin-binding protein 2 [Planktothrix agardhii]KEI66722.1 FtsI [Planktothrix agardhii NIVA-CYA 126/8]MCB8763766.1 penicillin-binding protein 2 [Planktothrix agardhii 1809]MCB8777403.1 penicillin-binding protein 2 [Planktothrix agardhii 1031]MCB8781825.1 penicillin-binding protein 2 [Planktothrix agardhii 1808]MCF3568621.1 penicillin-binding protein 2 [Planktothrix agardhii 1807]